MSVSIQVTGSLSAHWTVWPLPPGSFTPLVTPSVCPITTWRRDSARRPTRTTQRSSAHLTTPDWTLWNMERWVSLSVCLSVCLYPSLTCLSLTCLSLRSTLLWLTVDQEPMIWPLNFWTSHQLVTSDWGFSESEHSMLTWWRWAPGTPGTLTPSSPGGWDRLLLLMSCGYMVNMFTSCQAGWIRELQCQFSLIQPPCSRQAPIVWSGSISSNKMCQHH